MDNEKIIEHLLTNIKTIEDYFHDAESENVFYNNLFNCFDDDFIKNHIELFDVYQLEHSGRINIDILECILDNIDIHDISRTIVRPTLQLSEDFMIKYIDKLYNQYYLCYQKNIMSVYRRFPDKISKEEIYLHNEFLSNEDEEYLRKIIRDELLEMDIVDIARKYARSLYNDTSIKRLNKLIKVVPNE